MRGFFGRFKEITTKNFPGEVCLKIEFAGCNLKCGYCNVASILEMKKEYERDIDLIKSTVMKNIDMIDGIVLTGGEPTLQPDIVMALAKFAKKNNVITPTNPTQLTTREPPSRKNGRKSALNCQSALHTQRPPNQQRLSRGLWLCP